jgi:hypothetical protein
MFTILVLLVYLLAFASPVYLLYQFHSRAWYWHALAILAALGLGSVQRPAQWNTPTVDLALGAVFLFLIVWGLGGLVASHTRHEKHA